LRHEVHGVTRGGISIGDAMVPLNLGKSQIIAEGTLVDGRSLSASAKDGLDRGGLTASFPCSFPRLSVQ
jgi:hypothetical protein